MLNSSEILCDFALITSKTDLVSMPIVFLQLEPNYFEIRYTLVLYACKKCEAKTRMQL